MQELIKITVNANGNKVVSARDLHEFLKVETPLRLWLPRMTEYGFVENVDFTPYFFVHPQNKQSTADYALTLDCAKEISMLQRTEKGKQARQYFIACEKQLKAFNPAELTRMDILQMALEAEHKVLVLEEQNQLQAKELKDAQPHVNYSKNVLQSDNGIRITIIAKELSMSAEKLNDLLHQKRVQYKQNGTWVLYDKYQDKGYTKTLTVHFTTSTGAGTSHLTVWTETGRMFIHQLVNEKIKTA